jgi:hypothetical protein
VLGSTFSLVSWAVPLSASTLAAAFLLGLSERLFDSLVQATENQGRAAADSVDKTIEKNQSAQTPTPAKKAAPASAA